MDWLLRAREKGWSGPREHEQLGVAEVAQVSLEGGPEGSVAHS
jgi:hypothetical protein